MTSATAHLFRVREVLRSESSRLLLSGSLWALVLQLTTKSSVLVATVITARGLGAEQFALFVSLQAFMLLGAALWDAGFSVLANRDIAAGIVSIREVLRQGAKLRLRLLLIPLAVLLLAIPILDIEGSQELTATAVFFVATIVTGIVSLLASIHVGSMQFRRQAIGLAVGRLVMLLSIGIVVIMDLQPTLVLLAAGILVGELTTIALWVGSTRRLLELSSGAVLPEWLHGVAVLSHSIRYAASGLIILIYNRFDVVIVTMAAGLLQAGYYAPASRVQDALLIFPSIATAALVPVVARQMGIKGDARKGGMMVIASMCGGLIMVIPAVLGVVIWAPKIVNAAVGPEFAGSVTPVRILALSIPFIAIGSPMMANFTARGKPLSAAAMIIAGFVVSVGGTMALAPKYGAEGAAWAAMMREPVVVLVGLLVLLRDRGEGNIVLGLAGTTSSWRRNLD